ncbi:alpha-2,8-polysialyltransferase family protein [Ensifer sp. 22460]|uniref:alpha-2,8-polysialyltransferase family protein n=1 Tax=Ensifer sp. 22460 TaxID=3453922 RepID=UPI003F8698C4
MNVSSTLKRKALFIVSQVGQVRRAQELASQLGITGASLAILYTKKNSEMPIATAAIADPGVFADVRKVEIHPASNDLSKLAAKRARETYKALLADVEPDDVFVCSFERHYAILCTEAIKRGAKLSLYEEGTAIYKYSVDGFSTFPSHTLASSAKTIYNRVWKKHPVAKYIFAPIAYATYQIAIIPRLIGQTLWELYKTPQIQKAVLKRSEPDFLNGWRTFDTVYASNPSVLANHFKSQKYVEASPGFDDPTIIKEAIRLSFQFGIDSETAIFATQPYAVDASAMSSALVDLLRQVSGKTGMRIFIKLHPREKPSNIAAYRAAIAKFGLGESIQLLEGIDVPAEYLAIYSDCQAVISISSSTLMYAPKHKQELRAISVGKSLCRVLRQSGLRGAGVEQIEDHIKILEPITYIEHM